MNHPADDYRAELDFEIIFANGGSLRGREFIDDAERPVHSQLLAAGIPICEHLTNLGALPAEGFRFSAVPPKLRPFGTFPVRAYGTWQVP